MNRLRRSTRLVPAFLVALLVFATTCLASWVALRNLAVSHHFSWARGSLLNIQEALEEHKVATGEYPDSLDELGDSYEIDLLDYWERRFQYARKGDAYQLCSLGRDGKPGGVGFDADIHLDTSYSDMRLPLSQYLFEAAGSRAVLWVAFLASVFAGAASYVSTTRGPDRASRPRLFVGLASHTALAIIVAMFLAFFYFAISNSGH